MATDLSPDLKAQARELLDMIDREPPKPWRSVAIANIAAALLAAERRGAQQQWQPIATAPQDGTRVWLWNGYRRCIGWYSEYADHSGGWHRQSLIGEGLDKRDIDPETHWAPLIAPPSSADQPPAQEP